MGEERAQFLSVNNLGKGFFSKDDAAAANNMSNGPIDNDSN